MSAHEAVQLQRSFLDIVFGRAAVVSRGDQWSGPLNADEDDRLDSVRFEPAPLLAEAKTIGYAIGQSVSGDTIDIATGTYVEHVTVNKSLALHGAGAGSTVIDGAFNATVITIGSASASLTAAISELTIQHGQATNGGGLSSVPGTGLTNRVVLTRAVVSGNKAYIGGQGGGIYNAGTLTVSQTTINGNSMNSYAGGPGVGGGIYNTGTLTVAASTVSGNLAQGARFTCWRRPCYAGSPGFGGGLYVASGTATLTNTTVSGNTAMGVFSDGGGLYLASGTATLTNATASGNTAEGVAGTIAGGGIRAASGVAKLTNTILAKNNVRGFAGSATNGPDCMGDPSVVSGGHNLLGWSLSCTGFTGPGDLVNVNPVLGPLQDNGGPTFTTALGAEVRPSRQPITACARTHKWGVSTSADCPASTTPNATSERTKYSPDDCRS